MKNGSSHEFAEEVLQAYSFRVTCTLILRLFIPRVFINSELASVKAHDREVTQQAKYAQDEVIWPASCDCLLKL